MNARLVRPIPVLLVMLLVIAALAALAASTAPSASALSNQDYYFISSMGPTYGTGHTFAGHAPYGVATDASGNVYVTLPFGIAKFYSNGTLACTYTGDGGSYTMGPGYGLDVDSNGILYVVESDLHRIAVLHPDGYGSYFLSSLTGRNGGDGTSGQGNGQFYNPWDVAVDGNYLYVADTYNHRIQKFSIDTYDYSLTWVASWGKNSGDGTGGSGNGEFSYPTGIAADHAGHIFVAEWGNHRIQKLTTNGAFVTAWGVSSPSTDPLYMFALRGIEVDGQGYVYATDSDASTSWVDKFAPWGDTYERFTQFGGVGTQDSQFDHPWGVAVAPNGYVYVADVYNSKLKKFAMDATPPSITISGVPTGWQNHDVNVLLTATDPTVDGHYTSGLDYIWVSLTGGGAWNGYTSPHTVTITTEGDTPLNYWAEDHALNSSTPVTVHIRIDKTAPITTVTGIPAGWSKTAVTATLGPSDALSGVASTAYSTDGGATWTPGASATISSQGTTTLLYRSTDVAGNVEAAKTATVRVDSASPTTTVSGVPAGWSKTAVTATFGPSDALSGVASTAYSTDGGATWTPGTSATISAPGTTILLYRSTDVAGNVEAVKTATVRIDTTAPETTCDAPSTWSKTPVTVHFTAADALSHAASTEYSTDGGATWTAGSSVTVSAQGTTTLSYRSTDVAGNVEATKTATVRVDGIKPAPKALANATVKRGKTVKLRCRVDDSACPQATVTIKIFKGTKQVKTLLPGKQYTGRDLSCAYKCTLAKGTYSWKVYATDLAGNVQVKVGGPKKLIVK